MSWMVTRIRGGSVEWQLSVKINARRASAWEAREELRPLSVSLGQFACSSLEAGRQSDGA